MEVVAEVAGIKIGEGITEEQLTKLVTTILHDILHYAHHVNSGKYDTKAAIERLDFLIKESYGLQ